MVSTRTVGATQARLADAAEELVAIGRDLAARGWMPATSGNLSRRLDGSTFAVTLSGRDKGTLVHADIVAMGLDGPPPAGVSAEAPLHQQLYRHDEGIGAVLHVHSVSATLASLACERQGEIAFEGYEMQKALRGITTHAARVVVPIFPNDQDIPALARRVADRLSPAGFGYLIAGHGLYAWGADLAEARRHVEAFEFLLTCELQRIGRQR